MASAIELAKAKMQQIMDAINKLFFVLRWIQSHGEIALLYAEDLTVVICRRRWFGPACCRRIDDVPIQDCYFWFGHSPHNLHRLHRQLSVPESFVTPSRKVNGGEEGFLVYLYHLTKGTPFTKMARFIFGGDPCRLSEMNSTFINYGYYQFYKKISGTSMDQWIPGSNHTCRQLIYNALSSDSIEEVEFGDGQVVDRRWILYHFDFASFRIFGFLDDFGMPTACPGNSVTRRDNLENGIQWASYSGYLHCHGLKAQVVYLPNGIVRLVFITEIWRNNSGVLNMSGLNDYLVGLLSGNLVGQLLPCLYCNGIFANLATILPRHTNPTPEERLSI
jgi:hypothetical protein